MKTFIFRLLFFVCVLFCFFDQSLYRPWHGTHQVGFALSAALFFLFAEVMAIESALRKELIRLRKSRKLGR